MGDTRTFTQAVDAQFTLPEAAMAAANAITRALAFCAQKMRLSDATAVPGLLREGDTAAHYYFEYGLARELGEHIGALDTTVQAVYLYTPDATPEDVIFGQMKPTLVHLVVWVQRKTKALGSLLDCLDRALAHSYAEIIGVPEQRHMLDAQIVDDAEVNSRSGFGAILTWLYNRPLLVWKR
jgi:hypothetical protein